MKVIEKNSATASLADYATEAESEPLVITEGGRPVAALVAIENADLETVSLSTNPRFIALIERSRARQTREGGISTEDMRQRLGLT
jgi:antitoxin (DNA-binding transcriptional repressor) of toxin-antitoxin stability system